MIARDSSETEVVVVRFKGKLPPELEGVADSLLHILESIPDSAWDALEQQRSYAALYENKALTEAVQRAARDAETIGAARYASAPESRERRWDELAATAQDDAERRQVVETLTSGNAELARLIDEKLKERHFAPLDLFTAAPSVATFHQKMLHDAPWRSAIADATDALTRSLPQWPKLAHALVTAESVDSDMLTAIRAAMEELDRAMPGWEAHAAHMTEAVRDLEMPASSALLRDTRGDQDFRVPEFAEDHRRREQHRHREVTEQWQRRIEKAIADHFADTAINAPDQQRLAKLAIWLVVLQIMLTVMTSWIRTPPSGGTQAVEAGPASAAAITATPNPAPNPTPRNTPVPPSADGSGTD